MSTREKEAAWHVLDFFCDDEDSSALTVFAHGKRFHIIADAFNLSDKSKASTTYHRLLRQYRGLNEQEESNANDGEESTDPDSGVDMTEDKKQHAQKQKQTEDPEHDLQLFMTEPLQSTFDQLKASTEATKKRSVEKWYNCPTQFYELSISKNDDHILEAVELEATPDLQQRMENLLPQMSLPKYITDNTKAETYKASALTVIQESDQPIGTPYHPCRVSVRGKDETHFLKVVDKSQPQAIKRELQILNDIASDRIHEKIHVPVLEGLVAFDDAGDTATGRPNIMGFLLTDIPNAKPLTGMLDSSIPQAKRDRWAKDAETLKSTLHEHGIIWGDAKADNYMVDEHDKLWIIDFGGSYTEGWVDPELNETQEGDDMGTEKTVNALHDPVKNTWDPEKEEEGREEAGQKRKAGQVEQEEEPEAKKRKHGT